MNDRLKYLFDRYLSNQLEEEELREFYDLVLEGNDNVELSQNIEAIFDSIPTTSYPLEKADELFAKIVGNDKRKLSGILSNRHIIVAAATIIFIGLFSLVLFKYRYSVEQKFSTVKQQNISADSKRIYTLLPDSSLAIINENSNIIYDDKFGQLERQVVLSGEAFFEVTKNANIPFVVKHNNVKIRVLGTKFNVNAYKDKVQVAVQEGRVQIEVDDKFVTILHPNQQIVYNIKTAKTVTNKITIDSVLSWHSQDLFFNDAQFEDVVTALQRRYDIRVSLDERFYTGKRLSATFLRDETLEQKISVISAFYNCTYTIDGKKIYLKSRP